MAGSALRGKGGKVSGNDLHQKLTLLRENGSERDENRHIQRWEKREGKLKTPRRGKARPQSAEERGENRGDIPKQSKG